MQPKWKPHQQSTFHRDDTVSFWNVQTQTWCRMYVECVPDHVLALMSTAERRRVLNRRRRVAAAAHHTEG